MRWQVSLAGDLPDSFSGKLMFVAKLFTNPWVVSSIASTLLAGISWMFAMTKFEISYAFPWTALNFVLMLILGTLLFNESVNSAKIIGTCFVMLGIFIVARA